MAVKVEVVTPVTTVSDVVGNSTVVQVVRTPESPITTNGSQSVIEVVGHGAVGNVIVRQTEPPIPHEEMLWFSW